MSYRLLSLAVLVFCDPAWLSAKAPTSPAATDLLRAKIVCAQLVGTLASESAPVLSRLRPLSLSRAEIEDGTVICSAGCVSEVHLRGGLLLRYGWANIPRGWPGYEEDPRIDYAELLSGRKQRRVFFRRLAGRYPGA